MFQDKKEIEKILSALGELLDSMNATIPELVVCGGSALNVLGLVSRTTKDVDVVAFAEKLPNGNINLVKAQPFPLILEETMKRVSRDFDLPENWLNPGPTSAVDFGLPAGLMERVETKKFGAALTIHFLSRFDQICFKLYAAVDQGIGKHYNDLVALNPNANELEKAARWSMTHDVSEEFRQSVKDLLRHTGHEDVTERL
ncbi:MAG: DUF6036 family nucleotidyltransferase [Thermodesulfovibrionales bacterium]|nr:DUF6036 family nucleotidyltransferase [Thermodesulfovibrionales bacterium]